MSNDRVDTNRPEYSWIPFFEELAQKLHEDDWREKQGRIVAELQRMREGGYGFNRWVNEMDTRIDPFSVFALINVRAGWRTRSRLFDAYKDFFEIKAEVPAEEPIVPVLFQNILYFAGETDYTEAVEAHWDSFAALMESRSDAVASLSADKIARLARSLEFKGIRIRKLSMAMYWIDPHRFLHSDTINSVLRNLDVEIERLDDDASVDAYIKALNALREHDDRPFPRINLEERILADALKSARSANSELWRVLAADDHSWSDNFVSEKYIGVHYDLNTVSLEALHTDDELRERLRDTGKALSDDQFQQVLNFVSNVKRGHIVVMPNRDGGGLRYGVVLSDRVEFKEGGADDDPPSNMKPVYWRPLEIRGSSKVPTRKTLVRLVEAKTELIDQIEASERRMIRVDIPPVDPGREVPNRKYDIDTMLDEGVFLDESELTRIMAQLERKQNIILQGPPGTGKTFLAKRLAYALMGERAEERVASVQFHQSYSYEDFVGGYRPDVNQDEQLVFKPRDGAFLRLCKKAREAPPEDKFVMLIDEINRGNLSRVFGELLMLIEADKRSPEHAVELQHPIEDAPVDDGRFFVPPNVYIIGTMNLADRSLTGMNVAMRRRFAFAELRPRFDSVRFATEVKEAGMSDEMLERIRSRMDALNATIGDDASLGRQYAVGHSFFCPHSDGPPGGDWEAWYEAVVEFEIRPLLEEYWFDDATKAADEVAKLKGAGTG